MFDTETVFILGAGASWHYGFPTGEKLLERIRTTASDALRDNNFNTKWHSAESEKSNFKNFLEAINTVNPLTIDSFLAKNPNFEEIGKLLISCILLEDTLYFQKNINKNYVSFEKDKSIFDYDNYSESEVFKGVQNDFFYKHDWLKFIVSKMCDLKNDEKLAGNKITFITFNYENSLEQRISQGIEKTSSLQDQLKSFFTDDRFIHVYGKLFNSAEKYQRKNVGFNTNNFAYQHSHSEQYQASQLIKLIRQNNEIDPEAQTLIDTKIQSAKNIYILGYGFDAINNRILGMEQLFKSDNKKIFFTNYKNYNRINKIVGEFINNSNSAANMKQFFIKNHIFNLSSAETKQYFSNSTSAWSKLPKNIYVEKSEKDVYRALAEDFDL